MSLILILLVFRWPYFFQVESLQRNIQPFARAPPRVADITCPAEGAHFFAHKTRKEAYYYCLNGRGVTLDCTPGLVYDAKLEECREPQFVKAWKGMSAK